MDRESYRAELQRLHDAPLVGPEPHDQKYHIGERVIVIWDRTWLQEQMKQNRYIVEYTHHHKYGGNVLRDQNSTEHLYSLKNTSSGGTTAWFKESDLKAYNQ
jgi:hypothetical protein